MTLNEIIMNLAMVAEHPNLPHLLRPVLDRVIEELSEMDPPEQCEDAVSRRATIDAINNKKMAVGDYLTSSWVGFEFAIEEIERLPSVTPKPRMGKWHYSDGKPATIGSSFGTICDQCGEESEYCTNFCGNYGADMRKKTE